MTTLDHLLVFGDVDRVGDRVASTLHVDPVDSGTHPGAGTRNRLFALRGSCALEVIGPDPAQEGPRRYAPDVLAGAGVLWWWAVRSEEPLETLASRLREEGIAATEPERSERRRPTGDRLTWETLDLVDHEFGNTVPFVIRWLDGAPPFQLDADPACELRSFTLGHPDPGGLRAVLVRLGLDVDVAVEEADAPMLTAEVVSPTGSLRFVSA